LDWTQKPAPGYALRRFPQRTCFPYISFQPVDDSRLRALVIIQRARLVKIQRAATTWQLSGFDRLFAKAEAEPV